jgi:hypothetical protein
MCRFVRSLWSTALNHGPGVCDAVHRDETALWIAETNRSLEFLENPCVHAMFFDSGGIESARPIRHLDAAPVGGKDVGSHDLLAISELNSMALHTRCLRFVHVLTNAHARLASGRWPNSTGWD